MKPFFVAATIASLVILATVAGPAQAKKEPGCAQAPWSCGFTSGSSGPIAITPMQAAKTAEAAETQIAGADSPTITKTRDSVYIEGTDDAYDYEGDIYYAYAYSQCMFFTNWLEWGTWPYQQRVSQDTTWCAAGGVLTSRYTHVRLGKTFCTSGGAYVQRLWGGTGYPGVILRSGGSFGCGVPKLGGWNRDHWFDDVHDAIFQVYDLQWS